MRFRLLLIFIIFLSSSAFSQKLAILDFLDKGIERSIVGEYTVRQLFTELLLPPSINLIPQKKIKKLIDEETRKLLNEAPEVAASVLGKSLGADILLFGDFEEIRKEEGRSLLINAHFIGTKRDVIERRVLEELLLQSFSLRGVISDIVSEREVLINLGSSDGVMIGDKFIVYRKGKRVGEVRVTKVYKHRGEGLAISSSSEMSIGDHVVKEWVRVGEEEGGVELLILRSNPTPASVYLNKELIGRTPLVIKNPSATFSIRLIREGYSILQQDLTLQGRGKFLLSSVFLLSRMEEKGVREEGKDLIISSTPTNALVYLNDELKGVTPLVIPNLKPSLYQVKLIKSGYECVERKVIFGKEDYRLSITLQPLPPPYKPPPPPIKRVEHPQLLTIITIYPQGRGEFNVGYRYPIGFVAQWGFLTEELEGRIHGLGIGAKYLLSRNFGIDVYYCKEEHSDRFELTLLFGGKVDTHLGFFNLYGGCGLTSGTSAKVRYFMGIDTNITQKLKLMAEYDERAEDLPDGFAAGVRYLLPFNLAADMGFGWDFDDEKEHIFVGVTYNSKGHFREIRQKGRREG